MNRCRSCGAPIRWVTTRWTRRAMPLDPEPTPAGNVVIDDDTRMAIVLKPEARDAAVREGRAVYQTHFQSCPNYERTRR